MDWSEQACSAFDVVADEFVVATPDGADRESWARLSALLRRVRGAFGVDLVFVAGGAPAVQALYGKELLSGGPRRGPFRLEAMPVTGAEGTEYGTLCGRVPVIGREPDGETMQALRSVARLIAESFDEAAATA